MSAGSNVLAHLLQWPRLSKFVLLILSFSLHRWQTLKFPDLTLSFNLADLSSPVMIEASRGPEQCTHFPCAALLAFLVLKFSRHDGHKTNSCWSARNFQSTPTARTRFILWSSFANDETVSVVNLDSADRACRSSALPTA